LSLLSGCATMKPTGYLNNYERLNKGNNLEKIWFDPDEQFKSSCIIVKDFDTKLINDAKGVTVKDVRKWLKQDFEKQSMLQGLKIEYEPKVNQCEYTLELAITQMTQGSASARMWAGELGAGHAKVQIEGKVTNKNKKIVLTFSDLRSNSGAIGLKDIGGDAGPELVKDNIRQLAHAIAVDLKEYMK